MDPRLHAELLCSVGLICWVHGHVTQDGRGPPRVRTLSAAGPRWCKVFNLAVHVQGSMCARRSPASSRVEIAIPLVTLREGVLL